MRIILAAVLSTALLAARSPATTFEVASIKSNKSDAPDLAGLGWGPDTVRARNQSPASLVRTAFGVQPDQVVDTPAWATTDRFDINAKVAPRVGQPTMIDRYDVALVLDTVLRL